MNESFKTKFGNIRIQDEKILITDNSNIQFFMIKAMLFLNLATGIMYLISHGIDGSFFSFIWIFQCISSLVVFIALMRFTHRKELLSNEIKSIKYLKRFNNQILNFKLKNKRIRRVYLSADKQNNQALLNQIKTGYWILDTGFSKA